MSTLMPNKDAARILIQSYYTSDYRVDDLSSMSISSLALLKMEGLVQVITDEDNPKSSKLIRPTERGNAWVEHIMKVPLPEPVTNFIIPKYC